MKRFISIIMALVFGLSLLLLSGCYERVLVKEHRIEHDYKDHDKHHEKDDDHNDNHDDNHEHHKY